MPLQAAAVAVPAGMSFLNTASDSLQQSLVFCDPPVEHAAVCLAKKDAEVMLRGPSLTETAHLQGLGA